MNSYEMISVSQRLIQYLQASLAEHGLCISITNPKGIIIASAQEEQIGKFCEPAFHCIIQKQTIEISPKHNVFFAGREGIYFPIRHDHTQLGAIALEGDVNWARAMETMCGLTAISFFDMEFYKEAYWGKLDQRNIFTKILLYCEEDPFPSEVHYITEKFNIDTAIVRIPILFILRHNDLSEEKLINEFKKNHSASSQDIICVTRGQNAVIFKALSNDLVWSVSQHRQEVETYVQNAQALNINGGQPFLCIAGSLQNQILNYHRAFRHALWVCNNCVDVRDEHETQLTFFYDFVSEYIQSQINMDEATTMFNVFSQVLSNKDWSSFSHNMGTLLKNNMNISSSAKELYLHRNTLINWINRYKQLFGMDPVNDSTGLNFTQQLYYFYTHSLIS